MRIVAYDVEIFPDLFTIAAHDCYSDNKWELVISDSKILRESLMEFFNDVNADIYVGYNNIKFDAALIHFILNGRFNSITEVKYFADDCVNNRYDSVKQFIYPNKQKYSPFKDKIQIDLLLMFNTVDRTSLKRLMVTLNWHQVMDLPFEPNAYVASKWKEVLYYNHNDVAFTKRLYNVMYEEIKLRFDISREYKIEVYSSSRSVMGGKLMEKMYLDMHPELDQWALKEMGTKYKTIKFKDIVSEKVKFKHPTFVKIKETLDNLLITAKNNWIDESDINFNQNFIINKTRYTMGVGGLHSINSPTLLYREKGLNIIDADVASFYPRLMINQKIYPKHLGVEFLELYTKIVSQRLAAKKAKIKHKAEALKITANSIFGKMGSDKEWFEDIVAMYKVTLNGQLFLMMLIEKLEEVGIDVFYANTDGITAIVKDEQLDMYYEICNNWQKELGLELEFQEIEKMMLRDVSNYTLLKKNGDPNNPWDIKEKGDFTREVGLTKQRDAQIVPIAVYNWFYHNIPIDETIKNCKNISDLEMTVKIGKQFSPVYRYIDQDESKIKEKYVQRVNRYYASYGKNSGMLFKVNDDLKYSNVLKSSQVAISNNWNDLPNAPVNYTYYINRAKDFISPFIVKQLSLELI